METKIYDEKQIDKIVEDLRLGQVVAVATDTVMGLAIRADSIEAFNELQAVKGRPNNKPFPVMVANLNQLKSIVELNERDLKLVDKWFPGAITFIFNKKADAKITGVTDTLALRIPEDSILLEIVERLDKPIYLTSANKSNEATTMLASETLDIFKGEIKSIMMKDALGYEASTIIDATKAEIKILRQGKITLASVKESLEE